MSLFTRYKEVEQRSGAILNIEWQMMKGGYMHLGKNNWTFLHRFFVKGNDLLGQQKEFVLRFQTALDFEPRFSWFTFEFMNPYEARIAYVWIKVWNGRNLKLVFNFGWRLTMLSKKYLQNQIAEHERRTANEARRNTDRIVRGVKNPMREVI